MKIRKDNEFIKQGFIEPSNEYKTVKAEHERLRRLFNPKNPESPKSIPATIRYLKIKHSIKKNRENNMRLIKKMQKGVGVLPYKLKSKIRIHPKLLNKKAHKNLLPSKPSMFNQNCIVLKMCDYIPKSSSSKRQRVRREEQRIRIKKGKINDFSCKERRLIKRVQEHKPLPKRIRIKYYYGT